MPQENIIITAEEQQNIQNNYGCDFNVASNYPLLHNHLFFEMTYIFAPTKHFINNETIWLEKNTLLLIRPQDTHCFTDCQESLGQINFKISCEYFKKLLFFIDDTFYDEIMNANIHKLYMKMAPEYEKKVRHLLDRLFSLPIRKQTYTLCKSTVSKLTWCFYNHFYEEPDNAIPDIIKNAILLLKDPSNFNSTVIDLLSNLGYSYMHIYRLFKSATGQSPNTFFAAQKLSYAANMLLYTDFKIIDIAHQVGFSSQARFDTAFKNYFDTTPSEYRISNPTSLPHFW